MVCHNRSAVLNSTGLLKITRCYCVIFLFVFSFHCLTVVVWLNTSSGISCSWFTWPFDDLNVLPNLPTLQLYFFSLCVFFWDSWRLLVIFPTVPKTLFIFFPNLLFSLVSRLDHFFWSIVKFSLYSVGLILQLCTSEKFLFWLFFLTSNISIWFFIRHSTYFLRLSIFSSIFKMCALTF